MHDHDADHDSVYDGLLGGDDSQWAFGTDFEDPLAGVDTTVPDGVDAARLGAVLPDARRRRARSTAHRLSEWSQQRARPRGGHRAGQHRARPARPGPAAAGPGRRRRPLARAGAARGLAGAAPRTRWRSSATRQPFRNVRLVEADNGDFAVTIARLLVFATYPPGAAAAAARPAATRCSRPIAAKGVKELTYHRDYAGRWFLTLAQGTEESRRRLDAALRVVWPLLRRAVPYRTPSSAAMAQAVSASTLRRVADEVDVVLRRCFASAGSTPDVAADGSRSAVGTGRDGRHTEAMGQAARRDAGRRPGPPERPVVTMHRTSDPCGVTTADWTGRDSRGRSRGGRRRPRDADADPGRPRRAARRRGRDDGDHVVVTITPTYSGCPAMATMRDDLVHTLRDHGYADVRGQGQPQPGLVERLDHRARARRAGRPRHLRARARAPADGPVALTLLPAAPRR